MGTLTKSEVRLIHCVVYTEGSQVISSRKYCISFSEDGFCL